jgi:hypothetical protein
MKIYKTADGTYYTLIAILRKATAETRADWDTSTQGEFLDQFNAHDWLIEAVNSGVVQQIDVVD